jgi:hypothetical protein
MSSKEPENRLKAIPRGAFSGPATQLKDIPKRNGESRSQSKNGAHLRKLKRCVGKRRKAGQGD